MSIPAEVQKRYSDTIEAAIAKAKTSRDLSTAEAFDGRKSMHIRNQAPALHGASMLLKRA
jgi:hypothetical protein